MRLIKYFSIALLSGLLLLSCQKKESNTVKFGATFPLTGDVASYGISAKQGIELKIDEINKQGGVLGKQIVVDFQDDKNDKKEAVSIFNKFATIDKVPVVFGSAGSTVSLAIAPLANKYHVVLISPISSSKQLSTKGGEYFFRTCPADNLQAEVLAKWVVESGAKKVAVVYTNNSWGKPLAEDFKELFTKSGGQVVLFEGIDENTTDVRTIISKIKAIKDLDAIVSPTYPKEGGIFVMQLKQMGVNIPLFGGDNWGSPEFLQIAGDAANGVYYTAPTQSKSPYYESFVKNFENKFHKKPDIFSAYAYDAATAIIKSVDKAKSFKPDDIKNTLVNIEFMGVSGEIKFKPNGDLETKGFDKRTIQNGKSVLVEN